MQLLFTRSDIAREMAFLLRYEWDGSTAITLPASYDTWAVRRAIALVGPDCCFEGDHGAIEHLLNQASTAHFTRSGAC